jgi:hypothetical protein
MQTAVFPGDYQLCGSEEGTSEELSRNPEDSYQQIFPRHAHFK